jgi:hypothetical protein
MPARGLFAPLLALGLSAATTVLAQTPSPAPSAAPRVELLVTLNGDPELGLGVTTRLQRYITQSIGGDAAAQTSQARPVTIRRLEPTGRPLDADADADKVNALIVSHGAHAALIGDVSKRDDVVVTHATLVAPVEPEGAETWIVAYGPERLSLPLAEGTFRFDTVNAGVGRVTDATQADDPSLLGKTAALVGNATKLLGLKYFRATRLLYPSSATISEEGVASFVTAVLAYHAGDFAQAEAQFALAESAAQPGSNAERDAAVLRLASAARGALARAAASGGHPLGYGSRAVRDVDSLGKETVTKFPWSIEARQTRAMFHLAVAAAAQDHLIDLTRSREANAARKQANAIDKLQDMPNAWAAQARHMAEAMSPLIDRTD